MTKRTRLIILVICAALFVAFTPYIILYSLGYRVNLRTFSLMPTGGLYVKATPQGTTISIDSGKAETTGLLSPYVFLQNLLPGNHTVSITKDGYYDYQKNLNVLGKQVTKLEHVALFKNTLSFAPIAQNVDYFSLTPNGNYLLTADIKAKQIDFIAQNLASQNRTTIALLAKTSQITDIKWSNDSSRAILNLQGTYYLLQPFLTTPYANILAYAAGAKDLEFNNQDPKEIFYIKSKNVYSNRQAGAILENAAAYHITNNTIIWLSYDGFLYSSSLDGSKTTAISSKAFPLKKDASYKIITGADMAILQENTSLFLLNKETKVFETLQSPATGVKISPDGKQIIYYTDHQITYTPLNPNATTL
ncbi:PEGA domain-containing protein, partial [Candidatus Parcubacteria bacterium]|nr:PEGA domain-containing protein [Candidatus Parcubacteria bacterium]